MSGNIQVASGRRTRIALFATCATAIGVFLLVFGAMYCLCCRSASGSSSSKKLELPISNELPEDNSATNSPLLNVLSGGISDFRKPSTTAEIQSENATSIAEVTAKEPAINLASSLNGNQTISQATALPPRESESLASERRSLEQYIAESRNKGSFFKISEAVNLLLPYAEVELSPNGLELLKRASNFAVRIMVFPYPVAVSESTADREACCKRQFDFLTANCPRNRLVKLVCASLRQKVFIFHGLQLKPCEKFKIFGGIFPQGPTVDMDVALIEFGDLLAKGIHEVPNYFVPISEKETFLVPHLSTSRIYIDSPSTVYIDEQDISSVIISKTSDLALIRDSQYFPYKGPFHLFKLEYDTPINVGEVFFYLKIRDDVHFLSKATVLRQASDSHWRPFVEVPDCAEITCSICYRVFSNIAFPFHPQPTAHYSERSHLFCFDCISTICQGNRVYPQSCPLCRGNYELPSPIQHHVRNATNVSLN